MERSSGSNAERRELHAEVLKIVVKDALFPFGMDLQVKVVSDGPVDIGGGFADIYVGEYKGEKVAIKRPRVPRDHENYENVKKVSASYLVCVVASE